MGLWDIVRAAFEPYHESPAAALGEEKAASSWPTLQQVPTLAAGRGPAPAYGFSDIYTILVGNDSDVPIVGPLNLSYGDLYKSQIWVHVVVNKLARGIGRLPLKAYARDAEGARTRLRDGPLAQLLTQPAPGLTPSQWKQQIVGDMSVYGNALQLIDRPRPDAPATSLTPLPAEGWRTDGDTYYYTDRRTGQKTSYPAWKILHFRFWSPTSMGFALAPLEPLRQTLAIEDAAQRLGVASFQNGARPSGVIRTDQDLSRESLARLRDDIKRLYGGPDKAATPAILTNGLDWKTMSWDMQQAAVIDHRKLTREEVCAVYDIPPTVVGILDRATFSNIEELHLSLYQDTLGPWNTLIEETLDVQLLAGVPDYAGAFVEFDLNEVLKGNIEARYRAYQSAIAAGWMMPNEARQRENFPAVTDQPEANELHVSLALGGSQTGAGKDGSGTPEPATDATPPAKATPRRLRVVKQIARDAHGQITGITEDHEEEETDGAEPATL